MSGDIDDSLDVVRQEVVVCRRCGLSKSRVKAVPGEGPRDAGIMFIGEAPGYNENQQGRPFVGAAGQFLGELLASIGLKREQVYIANVIKCRPPENRDPLPDEIEACAGFLDRQIALIRPQLIVTLGRYSMGKFFPGEKISRIHGMARKVGDVHCFAMYHPAAALHQASLRRTIEDDMKLIPAVLRRIETEQAPKAVEPPPPPEPPKLEQLGLF